MCESYWEMMFHRIDVYEPSTLFERNADNDDMAFFYAHLIQLASIDKKHERRDDLCKCWSPKSSPPCGASRRQSEDMHAGLISVFGGLRSGTVGTSRQSS